MAPTARRTILALLLTGLVAQPVLSAELNGLIKVGTISLDEDRGDLSAIQETFNIHDGFNLSRILLDGRFGERSFFTLDLEEINLDGRRGLFRYRVPGLFQLSARHDQHRQIFDSEGTAQSERKDWRFDARVTPASWLRLSFDHNLQDKDGDRIGFPAGTTDQLGNRYDYELNTGRFEAEVHKGGRSLALGFDVSDLTDNLSTEGDRNGHLFSARAHGQCYLLPSLLSHFVRGSYGKQELTASDLDYTLSSFQYVGVLKPQRRFQFKYKLYLNRIEDAATDLQTDYVRNDFDLTWFHPRGRLFAGYGYVTHDDDRSLTSSNAWRFGGSFAHGRWIKGRVSFATSEKTDDEQLTLLKDVEASRLRASLQSQPIEQVDVGVSYSEHMREFPVINVESEGQSVNVFGRVHLTEWGSLGADYTYSTEEYDDRVAGFNALSHIVTGRVDLEYIENLRLSAGLTYLDIGDDLDIEKSIVMLEGHYDLLDDYFIEVKYNGYNYDDYILWDRYYTANVVWVNVGYRLSLR